MTNKQIKTIFLLLITLILFVLVFLIFRPFLNIILWAILLSLIINPIYKKITSLSKISNNNLLRSLMAAILSFLTILLIVLPVFFILYRLAIELKQFYLWLENILTTSFTFNFEVLNKQIEDLIYKISGISLKFDISSEILKIIKNRNIEITKIVTNILSKIVNIIVGIFFLMITLYFILTDSNVLLKYFEDIVPIEKNYIRTFGSKFTQVMDIIIKGYFIVGLYQAIMIFIILIIFKYSNPYIFSFLTFIASFIPMLGATVIWLPISILIALTQNYIKGIIFAIVAGILVSTVDNFIRPIIISNKIKIHPLLLFFAIIGGLIAFGYNGVILGPLFLALLYSSLEIIKISPDQSSNEKIEITE